MVGKALLWLRRWPVGGPPSVPALLLGKQEGSGLEPEGVASDPSRPRGVFQRIRELEAMLEAQRRHLKELEEKVSGSRESSLLPVSSHPFSAPSPANPHVQEPSSCFEHASREEKCSLG